MTWAVPSRAERPQSPNPSAGGRTASRADRSRQRRCCNFHRGAAIPQPPKTQSTSAVRQRLYYPFVVGIIGGLCGLILALFGVKRSSKEQRAGVQLSRSREPGAQAQRLDLAVSALAMGQNPEAKVLLRDYQHAGRPKKSPDPPQPETAKGPIGASPPPAIRATVEPRPCFLDAVVASDRSC